MKIDARPTGTIQRGAHRQDACATPKGASPRPADETRQNASATRSSIAPLRTEEIRQSGTGFQPVDPWKSGALRARWRNLPHLETPGATFFVTFRCRPRVVLTPDERELVLSSVRHWDRKRIELDAAVVMPDHVHALFRITDGSALGQILHSIKGYSSKQVKKARGSGDHRETRAWSLWVDKSFDRIVRSEAQWREKLAYIAQNPSTARVLEKTGDYRWLYLASPPELSNRGGHNAVLG